MTDKSALYNNSLAWAEAEDVDMCHSLYQQGFLIDYFDDIICKSATCKTKLDYWRFLVKRLICPFYK